MNTEIIVAIIGALAVMCTGVSSYLGAKTSANKIIAVLECKVDTLSSRVDKHNNIIERTYIVEGKVAEIEREVKILSEKIK